jgi:IS30 family transposase
MEMTEAGMTVSDIARAVRRNHATVMYWQSEDMRRQRKAYYEAYNAEKKAVRQPRSKVKTTPAQRQELLALLAANQIDEMLAMQTSLGVYPGYTRRHACDVRLRALRARGIEPPPRRAKRRPQKLRLSKAISAEPVKPWRDEKPVNVPAGALDDARFRAAVARSITASAFGDPPPGYSALDRRNGEARV